MKHIKLFLLLCAMSVAGYVANSCRKDEIIIEPVVTNVDGKATITAVKGFYLLNEGNMGSDKASLDYFDYSTGNYTKNIFGVANPTIGRLGDVGNDIKIYGKRLYAVINCSNLVEVMDVSTARHIAKFTVPNARYIAFHEDKAYVSAYVAPVEISPNARHGAVFEYDTATFDRLREVVVGYQPEEMAIVGDKMYVANSGSYLAPNYDNTISVIDLKTFTVTNTITAGINLHRIKADADGDLYVCSRGNHYDTPSNLYVIDTKTDRIKKTFDIPASNLYVSGDSLYVYSVDFNYNTAQNTVAYAVINTKTEEIVSRNFITDGTEKNIEIPYGLAVNPVTKEIFVADAKNYVTPGTLYCFTPDGKKRWEITTGDIPAHIVFVTGSGNNIRPALSIDCTSLCFTSEGGSQSFKIISDTAWTIDCPPQWKLSCTEGSGDAEIVVTAPANTSVDTYTGKITVTAGNLPPVEIALEQTGAEPALSVSPVEIIVPPHSTTVDVKITTGIRYRYSVSETWLRVVSHENNILKLAIDQNPTTEMRTAELVITAASAIAEKTVAITQNGNGVLPVITLPDAPFGGYTFDVRRWIRIHTETTGADAIMWSVNGQQLADDTADLLHVVTTPGDYVFRITARNIHGITIEDIPVTVRPKTYENNIVDVFDYRPAPGQRVNVMPEWKTGDTPETMNAKALAAVRNRNGITLGGFGGYIVMGFDHVLANTDGTYDFRIHGNALPTWAEAGVITVSYDANGNGLPDDEWFEIAGAAYNDASTIHDYEITYTLVETDPMHIVWTDNRDDDGTIVKNAYQTQNYFPEWFSETTYTLKGTRLTEKNVYDTSGNGTYWISKSFGYGYVDNCPESQDCSKIKLEWAVDSNGNPVKLKGVDFIRVHCSMNIIAGWQGELSTEIYGFEELN